MIGRRAHILAAVALLGVAVACLINIGLTAASQASVAVQYEDGSPCAPVRCWLAIN